MKFSDNGLLLNRGPVVQLSELASSTAFGHNADTFIGTVPLVSRVGVITLILMPRNDMTWRMQTTASWEMRPAVRDCWLFVGLPVEAEMGYGRLAALPNSQHG